MKDIVIKFFIGDRQYAQRIFSQVPRVGDEVVLRAAPDEARKSLVFQVLDCVWHYEDSSPWVGLTVKPVD